MRVAPALLATLSLAACGEGVPDAQPSAAAEVRIQSTTGTGTVTAVDAGKGTVTIDHGPMPEIGWPAMIMAFKADPALLAGVQQGDSVAFDLTLTDGSGEITALRKQ
jgi:Cu/Ag efflux protein CusF